MSFPLLLSYLSSFLYLFRSFLHSRLPFFPSFLPSPLSLFFIFFIYSTSSFLCFLFTQSFPPTYASTDLSVCIAIFTCQKTLTWQQCPIHPTCSILCPSVRIIRKEDLCVVTQPTQLCEWRSCTKQSTSSLGSLRRNQIPKIASHMFIKIYYTYIPITAFIQAYFVMTSQLQDDIRTQQPYDNEAGTLSGAWSVVHSTARP